MNNIVDEVFNIMNSEYRPSHSSQYYLIMFIYIITVFSQ